MEVVRIDRQIDRAAAPQLARRLAALEGHQELAAGGRRHPQLDILAEIGEVVDLGGSIAPENLLVWDETRENPSMAFAMAQLQSEAQPLGVLRAIEKPTYENGVIEQLKRAEEKRGPGRLEQLIHSGDIWEVNGQSGGPA